MKAPVTRSFGRRLVPILVLAALAGAVPAAHAAVLYYKATLSGANEVPANASPGVGVAYVDVDATANTMHVSVTFSGLQGNTTASHIHCPTAVALTGTAGVATTTPTFAGFPLGVTFGTYDITLDMTQSTSYNPTFVTNSGGTTALAEAALFQAIADGKAYLNIHSTVYGGGEIRGFLLPFDPTPTTPSTWGRIKSLYR